MPAKYAHAKKRANARKAERALAINATKAKNGGRPNYDNYNIKLGGPHTDKAISSTMTKVSVIGLPIHARCSAC
jgi:hypothetical protein